MIHPSPARRRGQSLLEFAIVALILYLILAATLELGRALFSNQGLQVAADLAAREISRTPLSVSYWSLNEALNDDLVRERIYDDRLLVIDLDQNAGDLDTLFAAFPVVNQQLRTLMIFDQSSGRRLLRYPGALITPGSEDGLAPLPAGFTDSGLRVAVPLIVDRDAEGTETIRWVPVMEEISPGAFSVAGAQMGMVGIRMNYPFQAATLSAYRPSPAGPFEPNGTLPIRANDAGVTEQNPTPGGGLAPAGPAPGPNQGLQPNAGRYGLGFQLARGEQLRPFRRVLSAQALYRRELFTE